jgi:hypothetical protein
MPAVRVRARNMVLQGRPHGVRRLGALCADVSGTGLDLGP